MTMIKRARMFQRSLHILPLILACTFTACGPDGQEPGQGPDTAAVMPTPAPADTAVSSAIPASPSDTTVTDGTITPGPGAPGSTPSWNRTELVEGVQRFITAIDSNNKDQFWSSLSQRSLNMADRGGIATRDEIWSTARQTLADIENRRITVIGGRTDSVALRIDGLRLIDSVREDDPIIIHLLREENAWKVMYPGLLYPRHHLRK